MSREQLREEYLSLSEYDKGYLHGLHCSSCKHLDQSNPEWDRGFTDGAKCRGRLPLWECYRKARSA